MAYDPKFDDEPFGKRERKERRPRTLAFVVVTMGLLSTCFVPILLCGQAPVAIPSPSDLLGL